MNKESKNMNRTRRLYTKPRLEQVQLVLEEAVLETCKTGAGGPMEQCKVQFCARTPKAS